MSNERYLRLPLFLVDKMRDWLNAQEAGEVLFSLGEYVKTGREPALPVEELAFFRFLRDNNERK